VLSVYVDVDGQLVLQEDADDQPALQEDDEAFLGPKWNVRDEDVLDSTEQWMKISRSLRDSHHSSLVDLVLKRSLVDGVGDYFQAFCYVFMLPCLEFGRSRAIADRYWEYIAYIFAYAIQVVHLIHS